MTYTFWHAGALMGEAPLQKSPLNRRQRAGIFTPTAYGLEILPRLTGLLAAGRELKQNLLARGLSVDTLERADTIDLLEKTSAGQKMLDVGRVLSEVEVRDSEGQPVNVASIAFTDLKELQTLMKTMDLDTSKISRAPDDGPRFIVSFTKAVRVPWSRESRSRPPLRGQRRFQ